MGNRTDPRVARSGLNTRHMDNKFSDSYIQSFWYAKGSKYADLVRQDHLIRSIVNKFIENDQEVKMSFEKCVISRSNNIVVIELHSSAPNLLLDYMKTQKNENSKRDLLDIIKRTISKCGFDNFFQYELKITSRDGANTNAKLIANSIGALIVERGNYFKKIFSILKMGSKFTKGIVIKVKGRLNGSAIAREESYKIGSVSSISLDQPIDSAVHYVIGAVGSFGIRVLVNLKPNRRGFTAGAGAKSFRPRNGFAGAGVGAKSFKPRNGFAGAGADNFKPKSNTGATIGGQNA